MSAMLVYLPGDGVGPEVGDAALKVLDAVTERFGLEVRVERHLFGGAAIDAHGAPLPEPTRAAVARADAVLLGAVGGPKWDGLKGSDRPEAGLLALRKEMGVWANLRLIKTHPAAAPFSPVKADRLEGVDILFVRELTGGVYFGAKGRIGDRATDECAYSVAEVERVARRAGDLARGRRGRVVSIDKANVMETSRLWREVVSRVFAAEYAEISLEHELVDAAAMRLISAPGRYDVILTENMFGDILTDEASVLTGSLGLPPSASLGDGPVGLYEPIHGSAPDIAGQGRANPMGAIASLALLLRHSLNAPGAADAVEQALDAALGAGEVTPDLGGALSTDGVAEAVARRARVLDHVP